MDQKIYKYGVFPFGLGLFGIGPILEEEDETMLVKYNTGGQKIYTSLTQYGDVVLTSAATIVAGDAQISIDDAAFQNLASLPTVSNSKITVTLTAGETLGKLIQIRFKDQTVPPEWNDKIVSLETYGNANAYIVDQLNGVTSASNLSQVTVDISSLATSAQAQTINTNVLGTSAAVKLIPTNNNGITVSASNFVPTDISSLATSAVQQDIFAGVNGLIVDVMYDPDHSLSALDVKILGTSAAVKLIPTDNNGITVSASNFVATDLTHVTSAVDYLVTEIDNTSYGLSAIKAKVDVTVADVLGSNIDGMTMEEALTKILAWAIGKTEYASDVFTYFKQDNATQAFALSASDTNRTRL